MKYGISMPFTGYVYKEVEAENEDEALANFYNSEITIDDAEEWDTCQFVTTGNVTHAILNNMIIEELED